MSRALDFVAAAGWALIGWNVWHGLDQSDIFTQISGAAACGFCCLRTLLKALGDDI